MGSLVRIVDANFGLNISYEEFFVDLIAKENKFGLCLMIRKGNEETELMPWEPYKNKGIDILFEEEHSMGYLRGILSVSAPAEYALTNVYFNPDTRETIYKGLNERILPKDLGVHLETPEKSIYFIVREVEGGRVNYEIKGDEIKKGRAEILEEINLTQLPVSLVVKRDADKLEFHISNLPKMKWHKIYWP